MRIETVDGWVRQPWILHSKTSTITRNGTALKGRTTVWALPFAELNFRRFLRLGRPSANSLIPRECFEQSVAQLYKMDAESRQQCLCSIVLPLY